MSKTKSSDCIDIRNTESTHNAHKSNFQKSTSRASLLLIFLIIASASIPAVSADTPSDYYYKLHDLCVCNAKEDLGHIPYLTWGIGYKAGIDNQNDKLKIFIHAGDAKKEFIITPETNSGILVTLTDFVNNVDKCRAETDQIPTNILDGLVSGTIAAGAFVAGGLLDNAYIAGSGVLPVGVTIDETRQSVDHWNNAKNAQKNAEKLFEVL